MILFLVLCIVTVLASVVVCLCFWKPTFSYFLPLPSRNDGFRMWLCVAGDQPELPKQVTQAQLAFFLYCQNLGAISIYLCT